MSAFHAGSFFSTIAVALDLEKVDRGDRAQKARADDRAAGREKNVGPIHFRLETSRNEIATGCLWQTSSRLAFLDQDFWGPN
jgi:hypothetical protein